MPRSRDLSAIQSNNPRQQAPPYGDNRVRTGDPLLAKQVLYQLSYVPRGSATSNGHLEHWPRLSLLRQHPVVGQGGLEPPTPRLSSVCSNQLSY